MDKNNQIDRIAKLVFLIENKQLENRVQVLKDHVLRK